MKLKPKKKLLIKLGTACNLNCPHCHQAIKTFKEHPKLIDWIKEQNFDRISFSGGEPLMYFKLIKKIMTEVGKKPTYRMMTNATLLTKEMAEFFNQYDFIFGVSYDGKLGGRDLTVPIQWKNVDLLKSWGFSTVFSSPTFSFKDFSKDVSKTLKENNINREFLPDLLKINWIHQTKDNPNIDFNKEAADLYIKQVKLQINKAIYCFLNNRVSEVYLKKLLSPWIGESLFNHGVACCNENMITITLGGEITLCPYGNKVIGTIDEPLPLKEMDAYIPKKCLNCELWNICKCSCVASVTDLECYTKKELIPYTKNLLKSYKINLNYLE